MGRSSPVMLQRSLSLVEADLERENEHSSPVDNREN
jgi:hypothetical protein